jgi:hypothetical protein
MRSHNSQVTAHIAEIKDKVEAATSQDDLVSVIRYVENHPGPLDYKDTPYRIYSWAHLSMVVLMMLSFLLVDSIGSAGIIFLPVYWFVGYSYLWLPALSFYVLWTALDDRNKRLPLPVVFDKPSVRILLSLALGAGLWFVPMWPFIYWDFFSLLSNFVGGFEPSFGLGVYALVIGGLLWFWLRSRKHWRNDVSERIFLLDALFNNNLKPVEFSGDSMAKSLCDEFREFKRGNDIRRIEALYKGRYEGDDLSFEYQLYYFHYVQKRTQTYKDSNGNTQTRTVRDHYYRHGILMDFPYAKALSLDGDHRIKFQGEDYRGTSNAFNKTFKAKANDPLSIARFLSPVLEERFVQFSKAFKLPTLEVSFKGRLCLAVDNDVLALKRQYGLDNPRAFAEEIEGHTDLSKLQEMLALIHDVMRFNDNNFSNTNTNTNTGVV